MFQIKFDWQIIVIDTRYVLTWSPINRIFSSIGSTLGALVGVCSLGFFESLFPFDDALVGVVESPPLFPLLPPPPPRPPLLLLPLPRPRLGLSHPATNFTSYSISFHDAITLISVAASGHYMTHHTYAEVRWSCEHDILIVTTPSRRSYHVVSTEGKRSLPLMYRPIRNSTWIIASLRLHQWILLREK